MHLQPWWLDAVCGPERWDLALSRDHQDNILGAMPYYFAWRWGLKVIQLPPLTTYAGPWLQYPQSEGTKALNRPSFEKKVMADLIRQLPKTVFFKQNFRPEVTNWLPFYWEGFRQTTRYTYVFDPIANLEEITASFKNTLRSDLKKAALWTEIRRNDAAWATVFALNKLSFKRKKMNQPYTLKHFQALHKALSLRNQSACFVAYDRASGQPSAGLYLIFDQRQASVLLTGTDPAFKFQCGVYALLMESLRFCAQSGIGLDFEGSMDKGIEFAFRAFNAKQTPYFQVTSAMWSM